MPQKVLRLPPPRPARPQARRADPRQGDPRGARRLRHRDRGRPARRTPSAVFLATIRAALATRSALARGQRHLDRRASHRAAAWFLDGEAERRARGAPAAREVKGRREVAGLGQPFAVTARADRIDRVARRLRDLRLQVGQQPVARPRARAFHLQLPLEAAIAAAGGFEGLDRRPGRSISSCSKFGKPGETQPYDPDPDDIWERFVALDRATTSTRPTASPPASARSSSPGAATTTTCRARANGRDGDAAGGGLVSDAAVAAQVRAADAAARRAGSRPTPAPARPAS